MKTIVNGRGVFEDRSVCFTSRLSEETAGFEEELRADLNGPVELALGQQHAFLRETPREFRLFQMRDSAGKPAMQAAVYLSRSRLHAGFSAARIPRMAAATSPTEEAIGLRALRQVCAEDGSCMTLRLQPLRLEPLGLVDFEARARRAGFHLVEPIEATRTLVYDLKPEPEALLAGMRKSTRARVRHKSRETVTIVRIDNPGLIPRCREAENAAHGRTDGGGSHFDFETVFRFARQHPDRAFVAGLYLKSRPNELMAFVSGLRHGRIAEYTSAGSFHDPELRATPFNSFLLWELILWARASGAELLDLGGITDGGPDDPLAGISEFKRYFTDRELEVGREMLTVLQPARYALFQTIQATRRWIPGLR